MRYNGKELSWLARQPRGFQREGNLFVGNVPPGSLLHRRPVLSERWGRLRGNLLFLLKSRDKESDADEVVVLERCVICTDNDGTNCGLTISFPGPGVSLYLEASGRSERDAWSRALGRAGAEALAVRVAALRAAISGLRGLDPRAPGTPGTPGTPHPPGPREGGNPALELSIACRGLPCGPGDSPPSPFARVYVYCRRALAPTWTLHSHTETIEATCAPEFLVSAAFFPAPRPLRICVSVCDSRDRSGPDGVKVLGKVECSVEELLRGGGKLSLPLKSEQGVSAGEVRLQGWASDSGEETVASSPLLGPRGIPEWRAKRYHSLLHDEFLRTMFCNECVRTYRVPGHVEAPLRPLLAVQERMAESRLSFHVPRQLLQMRLRQLSAWLSLLQSVDPLLPARVEERRQRLLALGTEQVEAYTEALTSLHAHHGPNFKASRLRRERALSFVPINLHVQRLRVQDAHTRRDCTYDVVTVGAPAAHVLGFKGGGLRSLMARGARLGVLGEQDEMRSLLQRLWKLKLRFDSHHASLAASPLTTEELSTHLAHLVDTTQQLVSLCEREAVCDAVLRLARSESQETRLSATTAAAAAAAGSSTSSTLRVASRREWRLLLSRVEEELELLLLSSGPEHDLRARVSLLAPRVCAACDGACRALLAIALESEACWGSSLSQRRDVVDSHTLSALVVGCVLRLRAGLGDAAFLQQLQHAGLLVCFESLLSTYGDEQAMLEDMAVSVMDLSHRVSLRLTLSPPGSEGDSLLPSLTEDGEGCVVSVPLPAAMFRTLPEPLRDGALVPVSSALFSIGINEQQTLVERFHGDTSLQEQLCVESCERLRAYHKLACAYLPSPEPRGDAPPPGCWRPLPELLEELAKSAASRRNKNVHVLQVAAQVCQRLRGVRVTSCKSAKDRTAMSVTLEQCALLRDRHGLPASTFSAALNCMRSEGCRLENAAKNVGCRRYAFHTLQLATFPRFYRPPEGTYGKVDT